MLVNAIKNMFMLIILFKKFDPYLLGMKVIMKSKSVRRNYF